MSMYHAEVVNLSLKNDKILKDFLINNVKKRFFGYVKIYTISVEESAVMKIAKLFQQNMGTKLKKEWYITFHNSEHVVIVFRKRIFTLSGNGIKPVYQKLLDTSQSEHKDEWDDMIRYAKSLGIPDSQCDFLPEDFCNQEY